MYAVRILLAAILATAAPLSAQRVPVSPAPAPPRPMVNADLVVTASWLAERLESPEVVVLHVGRDDDAYRDRHIPGARFLDLSEILTERDGLSNELPDVEALQAAFERVGVSDDSHVVLYGELGGLAAARAFFTLDYLGHPRVSILDGGLDHWVATRRPLATESPAAARGSLTPRPRPERLATADWLRDRLLDPSVVLIDARPPAEFTGEQPGTGIERQGHIPGARSIFWRTTLRSDDDPRIRDPRTLRAMFRAAGAAPGRIVVVYCRTGMQASHAYFVARYLGYDVRLYDGSFFEWSRRPELPVTKVDG